MSPLRKIVGQLPFRFITRESSFRRDYVVTLAVSDPLQVSGVLSVVIGGLYMSFYGRPRISPSVQVFRLFPT